MLDAYLRHKSRARISSELVYLFIDERVDRVAHLEHELAQLALPPNVKVHVATGRFEDLFTSELDAIQAQGSSLAPTFAFIDPFGYSDAPMSLTGRILQFERCEVLIYMPLPFVQRFVGRDGQDVAMTSLFGSDQWREAIPLSGDARMTFLHNLFRDQLLASGSKYVRSFEIAAGGSHGYHLFFGTRSALGLERMKEAMWRVDPITGMQFTDSTDPDQPVLFELSLDPTSLVRAVRRRFAAGEEFTITDLEDFVVLETAFLRTHIRRHVLLPAEDSGALEVVSPRKRARSYPQGTRLRFNP
jgi:three-Cys-motif partner protein